MKRTETVTILLIGFILLAVGVFLCVTPLITKSDDSFDIPQGQGISESSQREEGERIEGYFTVIGGDERVNFLVTDPYEGEAYYAGTIVSRHEFVLTTKHEGTYTFWFGNPQDSSGKVVFITYIRDVSFEVPGLIMASLGVLLTGIGIVYILRENSAKALQQQETS